MANQKIIGAKMNFNEYQEKAWSTFKLQSAPNKLIYLTLGINGEAGEIAEKVKKLIRDCGDGSGNVPEITEEKRGELKKELGDVLWYLAGIATALDLSLEDVAVSNIEKLASRKERGVIGGNGDNR
jgi:NTP pyrophosphatase (non-canonical NTP hydrolase)